MSPFLAEQLTNTPVLVSEPSLAGGPSSDLHEQPKEMNESQGHGSRLIPFSPLSLSFSLNSSLRQWGGERQKHTYKAFVLHSIPVKLG